MRFMEAEPSSRRERPRGDRAAEQLDELAPLPSGSIAIIDACIDEIAGAVGV
jgi:hypothetical protein